MSKNLALDYIFGDQKQEIVVEVIANAELQQSSSKLRKRSLEENPKLM